MAEEDQGGVCVTVGCDILASDLRPIELCCWLLELHIDAKQRGREE